MAFFSRKLPAVLSLIYTTCFLCCNPLQQDGNNPNIQQVSLGKKLAKAHCVSCHQYPEPALLDKASWENHILPRMGFMLGVLPEDSRFSGFIEEEARALAFQNPRLFRREASLSKKEWEAIRAFYLKEAPNQLTAPPHTEVNSFLPHFKIHRPELKLSPPSTTLIRFSGQNILVGDAHSKKLFQLNSKLELLNIANLREGVVDLSETDDELRLTVMGSFSPSDRQEGLVLSLPKVPERGVKILLDSLRRPVHTAFGDLNQDGKEDIVSCEYGKWIGGLAWWEQLSPGKYKRRLLRNMPGAIRAYIHDFNQDGLPDVVALFGQGDEGIFIYYNQGNGRFKEKTALHFPPSYGSSYFSLIDFNRDGYQDILYTNGDNADFPPVLKPYHGIRLFKNDGKDDFKEVFFYPMHGAYGAIPGDYDLDGDLDFAAISFFPDFVNHAEKSFLYLRNRGDWQFDAFSFPEAAAGRWLVMDSGDPDQDGDLDLLLGSLAFEAPTGAGIERQWIEGGLPFILLENTTKTDLTIK